MWQNVTVTVTKIPPLEVCRPRHVVVLLVPRADPEGWNGLDTEYEWKTEAW
jgi:hypothetical protein